MNSLVRFESSNVYVLLDGKFESHFYRIFLLTKLSTMQ